MSGLALLHRRNGRSIDEPLMRIQAKEDVQLHHQHGIRNVWKGEDQNGGFVGSRRYDAWAKVISSLGTIPLYGYTGREPDATGLIYYRARYYDPEIGRFIQRDPSGFADGVNLYLYARNNPVTFTDPLGLAAQDPSVQASQERSNSYYGSSSGQNQTGNSGSQSLQNDSSTDSGELQTTFYGGNATVAPLGPGVTGSVGLVVEEDSSGNITDVGLFGSVGTTEGVDVSASGSVQEVNGGFDDARGSSTTTTVGVGSGELTVVQDDQGQIVGGGGGAGASLTPVTFSRSETSTGIVSYRQAVGALTDILCSWSGNC